MRRCENCKTEILFEDVQFCEHCGATLAPVAQPAAEESDEFVVTESASERADSGSVPKLRPRPSDDLGLQSSAEVVQDVNLPDTSDDQSPAILSGLGTKSAASASTGTPGVPEKQIPGTTADGLKRLSPDQVKSIEKNLYSTANYLSENEKRNLLKTVETAGQEKSQQTRATAVKAPTAETEPMAEQNGARSSATKRGRGIAYYMKNYIQVKGDIELRDNDELQINNHYFLLRRKKFSPKLMLSVAGSVFALGLILLGALIISNPGGNQGQIVGFALDTNHQPYLQGASIRLPELGQTYTTNAQGFFRTDHIPPGSYRVEYVVNGHSIGADYATVASGEVTTLSLKPNDALRSLPSPEPRASNLTLSEPGRRQQALSSGAESRGETATQAPAVRRPEFGKIKLAANIENARFSLDGNILGSGNMTFTSIKPGPHAYIVAKDGYVTVGGSIDISGGETRLLEVTLTPNTAEPAQPNRLAQAQEAAKKGDYARAATLLSEQIDQTPTQATAYLSRAEAYAGMGNKQASRDDYLKAAELYRKGNAGQAMNCYNLAITQDPKSVAALLARANLHLDRSEEIAAIADFESVLSFDKRNVGAFMGLGEARYSLGNYGQAVKHFKDARSINPNNPEVHQYLMLAYLSADDLKNVKKSYDKFMELASQDQKNQFQSDRRFNAVLRLMAQEQ